MLKFLNYGVYVKEVPDELSLGFTFVGCPIHCEGCHSKHTWNENHPEAKELTIDLFDKIVQEQEDITCVLFFGGDWEPNELDEFVKRSHELGKKTALYSGYSLKELLDTYLYNDLDYLKIGAYVQSLGGLSSHITNQRLLKLDHGKILADLTHKFQH